MNSNVFWKGYVLCISNIMCGAQIVDHIVNIKVTQKTTNKLVIFFTYLRQSYVQYLLIRITNNQQCSFHRNMPVFIQIRLRLLGYINYATAVSLCARVRVRVPVRVPVPPPPLPLPRPCPCHCPAPAPSPANLYQCQSLHLSLPSPLSLLYISFSWNIMLPGRLFVTFALLSQFYILYLVNTFSYVRFYFELIFKNMTEIVARVYHSYPGALWLSLNKPFDDDKWLERPVTPLLNPFQAIALRCREYKQWLLWNHCLLVFKRPHEYFFIKANVRCAECKRFCNEQFYCLWYTKKGLGQQEVNSYTTQATQFAINKTLLCATDNKWITTAFHRAILATREAFNACVRGQRTRQHRKMQNVLNF